MPTDDTAVDFWFDPVCPYSWTASRGLHEVALRRPLRVTLPRACQVTSRTPWSPTSTTPRCGLARYPQFFELKRTRERRPVFT